jgi:hypothetical protein
MSHFQIVSIGKYNLLKNRTKISSLSMQNENEPLIRIEESGPRPMVKKGSNSHISGFNNNSKANQLNLDQFIMNSPTEIS